MIIRRPIRSMKHVTQIAALLLTVNVIFAQDPPKNPTVAEGKGRWRERSECPAAFCQGGGASDGRYVYVFGGSPKDSGAALVRYDPLTDKWKELALMPEN